MKLLRRAARLIPGFYLLLTLAFIYLPVLVVIAFSFNQQPKGLMLSLIHIWVHRAAHSPGARRPPY